MITVLLYACFKHENSFVSRVNNAWEELAATSPTTAVRFASIRRRLARDKFLRLSVIICVVNVVGWYMVRGSVDCRRRLSVNSRPMTK